MNKQSRLLGLVRSIGPAWLVAIAVLIAPFYIPSAKAAEIRVMISGGLTAAYKELVPQFEKAMGQSQTFG